MTDDIWTDRLSEYVDDELRPGDRADLERHLESCAECREALDELRVVVARAAELEDSAPTEDLWAGIAERIDAPVPAIRRHTGWSGRTLALTLPQLAAAACLLIVLSGGGVWLLTRGAAPGAKPAAPANTVVAPTPSPTAMTTTAENGSNADVQFASFARYDATIAELQRVLHDNRAVLDTSTVRVIEQNLAIIDHAITDARQALERDPANPYLSGHLAAQLQLKVRLLQRASGLVASHQG